MPSEIEFKNDEKFVCKDCICDPYKHATESSIVDIAKDLKMTKKAFLKVLKETKDLLYNPAILIDEFNKQIKKHQREIKELYDKIKYQEILREKKPGKKESKETQERINRLEFDIEEGLKHEYGFNSDDFDSDDYDSDDNFDSVNNKIRLKNLDKNPYKITMKSYIESRRNKILKK
jgi:hypothetical protein